MTRLVAGCMTGTSLDSLDAALVRVTGAGPDLRAAFLRGVSRDLGSLAPRLRALAEQRSMTAEGIAALSHHFALAHADALRELGASPEGARPDPAPHGVRETPHADARGPLHLVAVHGQTVCHTPPLSWQLLNPWPIVRELRAPVVFDLRGADLVGGGQGAPITPLADLILFGDADEHRAVVNLGGYCNVTILPPRGRSVADAAPRVRGMDVCACNHLLDGMARTLLKQPFDRSGAAAARGRIDGTLSRHLADLLASQSAAGRSLGTGDELSAWIARAAGAAAPPDVLRTACDALGRTIAAACPSPSPLVLGGGGVRNLCLVESITRHAARPVRTTADLGVPPEYREAACMAVLGALCQDRVPITLPQVTGVAHPAPLAGCWAYP